MKIGNNVNNKTTIQGSIVDSNKGNSARNLPHAEDAIKLSTDECDAWLCNSFSKGLLLDCDASKVEVVSTQIACQRASTISESFINLKFKVPNVGIQVTYKSNNLNWKK